MQLGTTTGVVAMMGSSINALPKVSVSRTCFKESGFHLKTISCNSGATAGILSSKRCNSSKSSKCSNEDERWEGL